MDRDVLRSEQDLEEERASICKHAKNYQTSSIQDQAPTNIDKALNGLENKRIHSKADAMPGKLHRRGQVDVVEMPIDEASNCKYFLVYEEQISKFVVLKALKRDNAKEVALQLMEVLSIIGAPQVLQSGNGRAFAMQVVHEMRSLWKDITILHGDTFKNETEGRDFKGLIRSWLTSNPTKTWCDSLKFVQILQNSTFRCQNGKIPCDILFGRNVYEEFRNLNGGNETASEIWTEEEWIDHNLSLTRNDKSAMQSTKHVPDFLIPGHLKERNGEDDNNVKEYESDTHFEFPEDQTESLTERTDNHDVNGFKFVNVKSELMVNSSQVEDSVFDDAKYDDSSGDSREDLKCRICQKQYMKLGHLKNHMKTHIKEKEFCCTLCNKTFRILSLYEKHMRQSHGHDKLFASEDSNNLGKRKRTRKSAANESVKREQSLLDEEVSKTDLSTRLSQEDSNTSANVTNLKSIKSLRPGRRKVGDGRLSKLNGDSNLECTYCKQKFNFPSVLKRHMRSHTNERPYVCEVCNKSFKQLGHLSQHSLTHKDYRSFQCSACGVKFASLDSLKIHSQSHKGETSLRSKEIYRLFECDNCKKVFTTKSVLERHIFTHTHERQFGCKICGKRFKQAGHVKSHMLVHTGERKFQCTVCSKRFSLSNSLKKHMYVHNGEKPYQCDVCGARFLEKRNLNGHLMTHTNERPFSCKICGKRYTLADTLRRHISAAHEDGRTYQCEICAKMFKQLAHLSVHKKVHNDERPFQCHLCDKNFKHKNVLKSHLAIHANVRPFECDVCKATFVRKTNLQTHIASAHMNERPYTCTICGKRFKQISHLNGHVVVHSNLMPYQCDFCDRRCNRLDNLKKHMRLHTKNKE